MTFQPNPDHPDYRPKLPKLLRRLTLIHDGKPFLERWGICHDRIGGFYIHRIAAPDPGKDLHDHPWAFVSIVLTGSYTERLCKIDHASAVAAMAELWPDSCREGHRRHRSWLSIAAVPLDTAHRIIKVSDRPTWTLVLRGPTRRIWNFYPPSGQVAWTEYDYKTRRPSKEIR